MKMVDKARRRENERRGEEKRKTERKRERVSIGIVRGRTCLYYTKGTDGGTRRPRDLPLMMLYSRLPRSLVPTRRFALLRSTFSRTGCVYRPRIADLILRSTPEDLHDGGAGIQTWKELARSLNGQLLLALSVPRFSFALYAFLFLIRHIVIAIKINSCSRNWVTRQGNCLLTRKQYHELILASIA